MFPNDCRQPLLVLITYACARNTALVSANSKDYYLLIDNIETLDNDRKVNEMHIDQPDRFTCLRISKSTRRSSRSVAHLVTCVLSDS